MKKISFLSLAALALLGTSCSNDETIKVSDSGKKAIAFQSAFINNATRAVDPSYSNISLFQDFSVWGKIGESSTTWTDGWLFYGVSVSDTGYGDDGNWTYTDTRYWTAGKTYSFAAVAPAKYKENVSAATDGVLTGGLKVDYTANDGGQDDDLLYAAPEDINAPAALTDTDPGKVQLTFYHMLSKVKFTFKHGDSESPAVSFKVTGVKITNANTSATVTMSGNNTDVTAAVKLADGNPKNKELSFGDVANDVNSKTTGEECAAERILIPEDRSAATTDDDKWKVTFTVEVTEGSAVVGTYNKTAYVAANLEPKKAYNFVASLTYENVVENAFPIEFNVASIANWDTSPAEQDLTID